jgi:serine protease
MKKHLRRCAVGALAVGAVAGGAAIALPANTTAALEWHPATYNLTETPDRLLPTTVSKQQPVRVVTTSLDADGKPVVKVTTATDRSAAARAVKAGQSAADAVGVELDAVVTATGAPTGTDAYRSQQWDFSKISVAGAWQTSTGAGVTVAVIDTGVDAKHPDLAVNVLSGYDAIANKAGVSTDPNGHGTHVAGTIAAVTGNGVGVSAIAPDTKILPVKVLGSDGSGYMSDTAEGIIWAADHGAGVINMSLGSSAKVTAVTNAITYARSKGVVVVAAAGNDRAKGSPTNYPAADAGVIGVAATDSADKVASYSNAGSYVDVAAPGSAILSTYPTALNSSGYGSMSGTSMATPHVAAVAALLKAYNPALTPDQVQAALQSSSVDLGAKGRDNDYGYGRIDAATALAAVTTGPAPSASKTTSATPTPTPSKATTSPTPSPTKTTTSPTPTPTKPVVKVRPTVKVTASSTSVVYGTPTTVTYTVTAGGTAWAGKPVQIGVAPAGSSNVTYTDAATDSTGKVVFTQPATGRFQVRLVVPATETSTAVTSSTTTVTVRAAATVTSPAAGSVQLTLAGPPGLKIQVQRYERSRWIPFGSFTAESAQLTVTGLPSGATVRLVVPSTTAVTGLTTASVKVA